MKALMRAFFFIYLPMALSVAAAAFSVWAWSRGLSLAPVLLISLLLLAAAQILFLAGAGGHDRHDAMRRLADVMRLFGGLRKEVHGLRQRLERLEGSADAKAAAAPRRTKTPSAKPARTGPQTPAKPRAPAPSAVRPGANSARPFAAKTPRDKSAPHGQPLHGPAPAPQTGGAGAAQADNRPHPAMPGPAPRPEKPPHRQKAAHQGPAPTPLRLRPEAPGLHGFRLYMEPVVDVRARRTALYRAAPALAARDGRIFLAAKAQARAARLGIAEKLDMEALRHAVDFLRRLRARGRQASVICPLSRTSLSSRAFRDDLQAFMLENRDLASGLTLDVSQETLSLAGEEGTLGLAWLAQNGVRLCLSQCHPDLIDAPALRQLGFAYLDMGPRTLADSLQGEGRATLEKIAAHGLQIIASGVDTAQFEARLRPLVPLARGRLYSPPRRVRMSAPRHRASPRSAA